MTGKGLRRDGELTTANSSSLGSSILDGRIVALGVVFGVVDGDTLAMTSKRSFSLSSSSMSSTANRSLSAVAANNAARASASAKRARRSAFLLFADERDVDADEVSAAAAAANPLLPDTVSNVDVDADMAAANVRGRPRTN